jgi:hypothetical protein
MTALSLTLLVALAGIGTPPRGGRPAQSGTATEAAPAPALSDADVAGRVHTYLASIDTPVTVAQWRALGPRAVAPLEAVLQDHDSMPSRRAKAVEALSVIGGERARQLVVQTARSEQEPFGVRASALRGAARVLSQKELVAELQPVMENARRGPIRATAAEVLARHGGASACTAVRAQAGRERAQGRSQFSRALERCASTNR